MASLRALEEELVERESDVQTCNEYLQLEPGDVGTLEARALLEEQIADLKAQITALRKQQDSAAVPPPPPASSADTSSAPKFDMSKHPKFRKVTADVSTPPPPPPPPPADDAPQVFEVKDVVMAKFSEDKQWYQATVVSRTGSSTDPVYTVTYKGYGNTETKRKHEIRPIAVENKKRKADGAPAVSAPQTLASPNPSGGAVISAAPSVDTSLMQRRQPSKVSDGPTRMAPEPKKLKGNKALDKAKSSWNDWQQKGPKKGGSTTLPKVKESQFRTPDLPNAKVGFTGSGKPMSRDQTRSKWNYEAGNEEEI